MKRRVVAILLASLFPVLAACGSSSESDVPTAKGEVTVDGAFGVKPKVSWPKDYAAGDLKVKQLIAGKGAKVTKETGSVDVHLYIASAEGTPAQAYSSYGEEPQALPYESAAATPAWKAIYDGKYSIGSRLLVTGFATKAYGEEGLPSFGIGRRDSSITVIDIIKKSPPAPKPTPAPTAPVDKVAKVTDVPRKQLPMLVVDQKDRNKVTGMKWDGIAEPDNNGDILRTYVKTGTGAKLTAKSTVTANYYGSTYKSPTPFDSSFSRGEPADFPLTGVVQGWKDALVGVPVGSRVVLGIPSRYAYGTAGQGESIPANSYLYFYVEVVAAK